MTWCLSFAVDAQTILDPFIGSGTSARAQQKTFEEKPSALRLRRSIARLPPHQIRLAGGIRVIDPTPRPSNAQHSRLLNYRLLTHSPARLRDNPASRQGTRRRGITIRQDAPPEARRTLRAGTGQRRATASLLETLHEGASAGIREGKVLTPHFKPPHTNQHSPLTPAPATGVIRGMVARC